MELLIREVRLDDAGAIVSILNAIIEAGVYTVFDTPLTVQFERKYLEDLSNRAVFYVAECREEQSVVGFQSAEPYATYTHAFDHVAVIGTYVDLSCRRRGIGTHLSEVTFETAKRKGYSKLFTYVRVDNIGALAFYLKLGFRIVGTAQKQARIGPIHVDEVIIEKFLAGSECH